MRKRSPFSRREFTSFGLMVLTAVAFGAVVTEWYYHPLETTMAVGVVIIGLIIFGILNNNADSIARAQNWRNPVGPKGVLSFSIEKEMKEAEKNI